MAKIIEKGNLKSNVKSKLTNEISIDAFVLMFCVILIVAILTYIFPAGQYDRVEVDGRQVVDPTTFHFVENAPVGFFDIFSNVHVGMTEAAPIILFVLLFGGALGIIQMTGALNSFIQIVSLKYSSKEKLLIPIMVLVFSLLGTLIGSAEDSLVYLAILVPMTISLGFDALTGFAIVMLGIMVGFLTGITNPFNVGVAQGIAELPIYSGIELRIALFVVMYLATVLYIYRHAMKVKKNPELGVFGKYTRQSTDTIEENFKLSMRHKISLYALLLNFIILMYGVIKLQWYISEIAGIFLLFGIIIGFICKLSPSDMSKGFIDGAKEMISGALIIGVAQTILVIVRDGLLLDSILYYASSLIGNLPPTINALGMFFTQMCMNFIVPSGSGQAALTMPIMTPLGDLIGVTRQTAVLAFQTGDGISNLIFPTSGVLIAALALNGIPYTKWLKWVFPFIGILIAISICFLMFAQFTNYGPF